MAFTDFSLRDAVNRFGLTLACVQLPEVKLAVLDWELGLLDSLPEPA